MHADALGDVACALKEPRAGSFDIVALGAAVLDADRSLDAVAMSSAQTSCAP